MLYFQLLQAAERHLLVYFSFKRRLLHYMELLLQTEGWELHFNLFPLHIISHWAICFWSWGNLRAGNHLTPTCSHSATASKHETDIQYHQCWSTHSSIRSKRKICSPLNHVIISKKVFYCFYINLTELISTCLFVFLLYFLFFTVCFFILFFAVCKFCGVIVYALCFNFFATLLQGQFS